MTMRMERVRGLSRTSPAHHALLPFMSICRSSRNMNDQGLMMMVTTLLGIISAALLILLMNEVL